MKTGCACVLTAVWCCLAALAHAAAEEPDAEGEADPGFARVADDEETIFAVQRKAYLVKGKLEITPLLTASFADRFVQTFGFSASATYHLTETFGIELFGSYLFPTESGLTKEILLRGMLVPETAKLTQLLWAAGFGAKWSPLYGKFQLMETWLANFSFYVGAGFGVGQSRVRCTAGRPLDPNRFGDRRCPTPARNSSGFDEVYEPATFRIIGAISTGVRFDFSPWLGLGFEVKDYVFVSRIYRPGQDEGTQRFTDAVRNNLLAQIGVSFYFGGEAD